MGSTAGPWDSVSECDIRFAWSNAFPDEQAQMGDEHVGVIAKLASPFFLDITAMLTYLLSRLLIALCPGATNSVQRR
jgi:hypothetical protein